MLHVSCCTFVLLLIQYATVASRTFPGVTASFVKPKPKKANKAEVNLEATPKEETVILISQEWLTTVAKWTFDSGPQAEKQG